MFFLSCVCYAFVSVCLYVPCDHLLGKGWPLGSRLWCPTVSLSLSRWYPGSGVVFDCIDSWSLHPYLLRQMLQIQIRWGGTRNISCSNQCQLTLGKIQYDHENATIRYSRPTHGTVRKRQRTLSHKTLGRQLKQLSNQLPLFLVKMIVKDTK